VQLLGDQLDPLGRGGQGFSVPNGRGEIIFNPMDGQALTSEIFTDGQLSEWTAFDVPPI
jgi:hypothetical protein